MESPDDKETKLGEDHYTEVDCYVPGRLRSLGRTKTNRVSPLFPVRFNHSRNGSIDTEIMVRRLNFPRYLADGRPGTIFRACGSFRRENDHGGTRLWWDTGNNNLE